MVANQKHFTRTDKDGVDRPVWVVYLNNCPKPIASGTDKMLVSNPHGYSDFDEHWKHVFLGDSSHIDSFGFPALV